VNHVTNRYYYVTLSRVNAITFVSEFNIDYLTKEIMNPISENYSASSMMKWIMFAIVIGLLGLMITSCSKAEEKSQLSIRMTDAPGNYDAVMIDLLSVEVTGSAEGTVILNTNAGIYNLLDFSNGINTLIATGMVEAGNVSQIRLILGPNNTVVVNNVVYPLSTPSAMQSGLKIQVHQTLEPGVSYGIMLDFDANQSIVVKGNGEYQLKPVIRIIDATISGSIRGSINPDGVIATVTATSKGLSYSSITNTIGDFIIAGLPAGTHNITFSPPHPRQPVTVKGIIVNTGVVTNIGIIAQ
jgi:hypothetical protein